MAAWVRVRKLETVEQASNSSRAVGWVVYLSSEELQGDSEHSADLGWVWARKERGLNEPHHWSHQQTTLQSREEGERRGEGNEGEKRKYVEERGERRKYEYLWLEVWPIIYWQYLITKYTVLYQAGFSNFGHGVTWSAGFLSNRFNKTPDSANYDPILLIKKKKNCSPGPESCWILLHHDSGSVEKSSASALKRFIFVHVKATSPHVYLVHNGEECADHVHLVRRKAYLLLCLSQSRVHVIPVPRVPLPTWETHLACVGPQLQHREKETKSEYYSIPFCFLV